MAAFVSGIQQVGIGVRDYAEAWRWYRKAFGMNIPVFEDSAVAEHMRDYTGGTGRRRTAVLAINLKGGGGFEIWQFADRSPEDAGFSILPGDLGITSVALKTPDIDKLFARHTEQGIAVSSSVKTDPFGRRTYHTRDPYGNLFQIVSNDDVYARTSHPCGGVLGVTVGVSEIEAARPLYAQVLGYDEELGATEGVFEDYGGVDGGEQHLERVLLGRSGPGEGAFGTFYGASTVELVSCRERTPRKIYEGRYWGDCGFIHVCFDVHDMGSLKKKSAERGFPFTVDSGDAFDMGDAAGRFGYTEDPDGTLIEFVETFKMPILAKLGWNLDLSRRDPTKPLPGWMLKALRLARVR